MKRFLSLSFATMLLVACVDTTGLSSESSRPPHPQSNANAVVVVDEFADLQCPACRAAHLQVVKPLLEQYGSQMRYEFHNFPLSSIHRYALESAEAAECAADQGKFWEFVDTVYERQDQLNSEALTAWAQELGLDMDVYGRCTASHIKRAMILDEYETGKELGVRGTPTFFVNGVPVEATVQGLGEAIEQANGTMQQLL